MKRRRIVKRKKNEILTKNELKIYDYYKCKRNLLEIMKNYEDLVEQLTETWHIPVGSMNDKTPKEIFDAAIDYCGGVSDRMNINRWFHIRDLLNLTIH